MNFIERQKILIIVGAVLFFIIIGLVILVQSLTQGSKKETVPSVNIPTPILNEVYFNSLSQDQLLELQNQADQRFKKLEDERYNLYPWYNSLPLITDKYFVYFDLDKKEFVGKIYSASEEASIKTAVLKRLKEDLHVQTEKYQFEWQLSR